MVWGQTMKNSEVLAFRRMTLTLDYHWQDALLQTRLRGWAIRSLARMVRQDAERARTRSHDILRSTVHLVP